jgi:SSS family transporter
MNLSWIDWLIISLFFIVSMSIGLWSARRKTDTAKDFFLSGRNMPWWLLGISMVATTFSTDTPNLVTDLVRQQGVSGNWGWWSFLLSGMLTVFVYAKLWRRSEIMTDIEFYELRYSGKAAAFLRGFRSLYLGLVFNVLVMGAVSLAAIKFGEIILGLPGWKTLLIAGSVTVFYSSLGGLRAVIYTDLIQFLMAMAGSILAAVYILNQPEVGGLQALLEHKEVISKLSILPDFSSPEVWVPLFLIPLSVQWWASYYPGAEPGGGGYIAQRMLSAKDEKNALAATLLFNVAHYAIRPWPWILIALASIVVFPQLEDIQAAFPNLPADKLGHDVAYPAMLTILPVGLIGLVSASLIAAFMSTMSTQLNLGASYLVNDFYKRFLKPQANEKELVWAGRFFSVVSAVLGITLGLILTNASQAFNLLLLLGSGTGLVYILRWFWWRINAYTEIIAMISSLVVSIYFTFLHHKMDFFPMEDWQKFVAGTAITTSVWIIATFFTPQTNSQTLISFYNKIKPASLGWKKMINQAKLEGVEISENKGQLSIEFICMFLGTINIYSALIATGYWIYGEYNKALILTTIFVIGVTILVKLWKRIKLS